MDEQNAEQTPLVTIYSNGYALIVETPTGLLAIMLERGDAERCFDAGVNYCAEVTGERLAALQGLDS